MNARALIQHSAINTQQFWLCGQDDFSDVRSALDEPMSVGGAFERKCARNDRREPPRRELADQHVHQRRKLSTLVPQMTDVEAEYAAVAIDHRHGVEPRRRDPGMERAQEAAAFTRRG